MQRRRAAAGVAPTVVETKRRHRSSPIGWALWLSERIEFNAPATLTLVALCVAQRLAADAVGDTGGDDKEGYALTLEWFAAYPASSFHWRLPRAWLRLFSHGLGHWSWDHVVGNASTLLLVCPMLEDEYGSKALVLTQLAAALATALAHMAFGGRSTALAGASSLAFANTLLASFGGQRRHKVAADSSGKTERRRVPLTLLLTAATLVVRELSGPDAVAGATGPDGNVVLRSALAHVTGGVVGAIAGFALRPAAARRRGWEDAAGAASAAGQRW